MKYWSWSIVFLKRVIANEQVALEKYEGGNGDIKSCIKEICLLIPFIRLMKIQFVNISLCFYRKKNFIRFNYFGFAVKSKLLGG